MKTASRLILVKHSLPEIDENIPARDWVLSDQGRKRAQKLVKKLIQYQPEVIVSSTEPKAQQTAAILGEKLKLKVLVADGLYEHDRSRSPYYSKEEFQMLVHEFFERPGALVFGSETANQAFLRFKMAIESEINSCNTNTVLVVTHGTVISLFISWLTGVNGFDLWKDLGLPSFVVLDMEAKTLLKTVNIN